MGADAALPPSEDATVLADTHRRGVDIVLDCAAKPGTADQSLRLARAGGRVVFTGIQSEPRLSIDVHLWRRKELAIYQVRRANREDHTACELLSRHPRLFAPLITHSRPLEKIGEAFAIVEGYADGVGKMLIRPAG
jgi:threonine dehydrogenase-like Zn-dependent dehydrogenase